MRQLAVVGGGIVGTLTALLAARRGWRVDIFEQQSELWTGASAANEGKVHLGLVFALGDNATYRLMLEGATSFARVVDEALGEALPWTEMASAPFEYLVMPGSLAGPEQLAARYDTLNAMIPDLPERQYLGMPLTRAAEPEFQPDPATGLPMFATAERAIDPLALRHHVLEALARDDRITVKVSHDVKRIERAGDRAVVRLAGDPGDGIGYDAAVNASWLRQHQLLGHSPHPLNYRIKLALRLAPAPTDRTLTMVHGPYGDVVALKNYTFVSWYPVGKIAQEYGDVPSAGFDEALATIDRQHDVAQGMLERLQEVGVLTARPGPYEIIGGAITGHGARDINERQSDLHSRSEFGVRRDGAILTPINYKFTTAPLVAERTIASLEQ